MSSEKVTANGKDNKGIEMTDKTGIVSKSDISISADIDSKIENSKNKNKDNIFITKTRIVDTIHCILLCFALFSCF